MRMTEHETRTARVLSVHLHALEHHDQAVDERLAVAAAVEREARALVRALVSGTRDRRATWDDVGQAFGVTRQAAQQRWG